VELLGLAFQKFDYLKIYGRKMNANKYNRKILSNFQWDQKINITNILKAGARYKTIEI
jgi:hypothetical protein